MYNRILRYILTISSETSIYKAKYSVPAILYSKVYFKNQVPKFSGHQWQFWWSAQHLHRQETLQDALWTDQVLIKHANPSKPTPPTNNPKIYNGGRNFFAPLHPTLPRNVAAAWLTIHRCMASDSRTQRMLVIHAF